MPIFKLSDDVTAFPPPWLADESGVLAMGGDLSVQRVLEAYRHGIFPWFNEDEPPLWWSPDPRFVLYPDQVRVSKSMRQVLRRAQFSVTFDTDFEAVMRNCMQVKRPDQDGSWISEQLIQTFLELHTLGFAHSVEVWQDNELVGGLYGGAMGKCFFGESMFSKTSNASKTGFITLVKNLELAGYELIDCQVHTPHLESLGAYHIPRDDFLDVVFRNQNQSCFQKNWSENFLTAL